MIPTSIFMCFAKYLRPLMVYQHVELFGAKLDVQLTAVLILVLNFCSS